MTPLRFLEESWSARREGQPARRPPPVVRELMDRIRAEGIACWAALFRCAGLDHLVSQSRVVAVLQQRTLKTRFGNESS